MDLQAYTPVLTIYGSYFFNEALRLVMFDAVSLHGRTFNDLGAYLLVEQVRTIDERFSFNLLIGAHLIYFHHDNKDFLLPSGPQGVELVFRDFGLSRFDLSVGGFVHPPFNSRQYYNIWLRWGTKELFGEVNYIAWEEDLGTYHVYNRSLGVTVGFPLFRFL